MDTDRADPDIQHDVDLIILDYLLCIGIDALIHGRKMGRGQTENWDNWVLHSIHSKSRSWGVSWVTVPWEGIHAKWNSI